LGTFFLACLCLPSSLPRFFSFLCFFIIPMHA
jgi:hypothetical protein